MAEIFVDSLYDAVLDCLKVIPILFLAYLLVSFLSHDHSHKFSNFLSKNKKSSVLYASLLGCVPQCGFSSVVADLYSKKQVSLGALVAVFIATSDEAIPIMISNASSIVPMLVLIAVKVVLAMLWGYGIELCLCFNSKRKKAKETLLQHNHNQEEHHEINHENHNHDHHHECGHIHTQSCDISCGHSHGDCCGSNIFVDAFDHTFNIVIYIFVVTFLLNFIISSCEANNVAIMENLFTSNIYLQVVIASLVGLIPNCASSVLLVELFTFQTIGFPALVAGLTSGAGVGLVILWAKNKKRPLQNLGILLLQFVIGVASGLLLTLFIK